VQELHRSLRGKLVVGLAALAVAAFAGGAYAATQTSGPNTRQAFLTDVAKRLNVTPQQLTAALNGAATDQLQAQVKAGNLTQSQANALEQRLKQKGANPAVPFGLFGPGGLGGPYGPGGPGGAGGPGGFGPKGFGPGGAAPQLRHFAVPFAAAAGIGPAATYLGLTDAQLLQQLSSGKSLAEIATAKGKSVTGLEQALSAAMKTRLSKLVAAKILTAAQEAKVLNNLSARIASQVNQKGGAFPRFRAPGLRFKGVPSPPQKGPGTPLGPASQLFAPQGPTA
jgi:hypothetical protein